MFDRDELKTIKLVVDVLYSDKDDQTKRSMRKHYALSYQIGKIIHTTVGPMFHLVNHKNEFPTEFRASVRDWVTWYNNHIGKKNHWLNMMITDYQFIHKVHTGEWAVEDGKIVKSDGENLTVIEESEEEDAEPSFS